MDRELVIREKQGKFFIVSARRHSLKTILFIRKKRKVTLNMLYGGFVWWVRMGDKFYSCYKFTVTPPLRYPMKPLLSLGFTRKGSGRVG